MSYQSGTPFLNLPQTVGSDHRDWFDTNEAFLNLDTKMKTLWDGSSSTETILTALQESVATLATDVTTLSGIVSGHTSTITTINESLVLINTALNALNTQVVGKFDSVGIADAYDATHGVYEVGDVVTYNGQRYVCVTAVTAAEPFDVSKWNAEDVQTAIDNLNVNDPIVLPNAKISLSAYSSASNKYLVPSDGYITLEAASGSAATMYLSDTNDSSDAGIPVGYVYASITDMFVKKGLYIYATTFNTFAYTPIHAI